MKVKAYKVKDFASNSGQSPNTANTQNKSSLGSLAAFAGVVDDFDAVVAALKTFPYKSAVSLLGLITLVFVAFKVGKKFGIIQSRIKRKGT